LKIAQGADLLLVDLNEPETAAVLNRAAIKIKIPLLLAWIQEMRATSSPSLARPCLNRSHDKTSRLSYDGARAASAVA
jgi:hypothetical protein